MTLQDLSNLGTFIAALATSISVLLALFTYRKGYQREALKNVREKIATYRIKYQEVNNLLDTSCSVELGVCISNEIKALVPRPHSTTAIAEFLENEDNVNYITQSCYLGLANAKTIQKAIQTSNELYVISSAEQEMFPITGKLLSTLSLYPSSVLTTINQTDYLVSLFQGDEAIGSLKEKEFPVGYEDIIFREMALWVTIVSDSLYGNISDRIAENAHPIVNIITGIFDSSPDSKLLKLSRQERQQHVKILEKLQLSNVDEPHEIIFELLKFYKPYINSEDWDTLVESKTKLGIIHSDSGETDI